MVILLQPATAVQIKDSRHIRVQSNSSAATLRAVQSHDCCRGSRPCVLCTTQSPKGAAPASTPEQLLGALAQLMQTGQRPTTRCSSAASHAHVQLSAARVQQHAQTCISVGPKWSCRYDKHQRSHKHSYIRQIISSQRPSAQNCSLQTAQAMRNALHLLAPSAVPCRAKRRSESNPVVHNEVESPADCGLGQCPIGPRCAHVHACPAPRKWLKGTARACRKIASFIALQKQRLRADVGHAAKRVVTPTSYV